MPKWISAAFALFLSLQVFSTKGETVDDVINNYMKAMGGRDRLISIKTVYAEAIMTGARGKTINVRTQKVQNKLFRRNTKASSGSHLIIITDSAAWNSDPHLGTIFKRWDKESVSMAQPELDCARPLVDYSSKGYVAELTGKQNVNGTSCFAVKLTLKSGQVINYFIDAENWHIIREIRKAYQPINTAHPNPDMIINYSDYRKTSDGYVFPFKVLTGEYPNTVLNYQKIEVNKQVNSGLYKACY